MKVKTISYQKNAGWSENFPSMDSPQTAIFAFSAPEFLDDPKPFQDLKRQYPSSIIIGCSTAGEIDGRKIRDHSISVAIVRFEKTNIRCVTFPISKTADSEQVGKNIASELNDKNLAAVFIVACGTTINGSALIEGINEGLERSNCIVTGGLSGDGAQFARTWVLNDGVPSVKHVSALGFYGDRFSIQHGSQGGWDVFGTERIITRSQGNKLFEIDGKPALDLYKEYLGDKAKDLPASGLLFPMQIRSDQNDDKRLVRTILGIDEKEKALIFAGDMPEGWCAQLMKANFSRLIEGAAKASMMAPSSKGDHLCLAISCVGRRLVLGQRTEEELEAVLKNLPNDTAQVGFYSYGELSPYVKGGACELHNQTMTLTLLGETL